MNRFTQFASAAALTLSASALCVLNATPEIPSGATTFSERYAPQDGLTAPAELGFRDEICLNGSWDFQGVKLPDGWKRNIGIAPELPLSSVNANGWDDVKIKIPSPWNVNSYKRSDGPDHHDFPSYPKDWENYEMGWLRKSVEVPANWSGKDILLHFEAIAGFAEVYVAGNKVAENFDIFLPFDADITEFATPGEALEILVGVRHHKVFNDNRTVGRRIVPAGSMWGQHIVGIWQDVYLFAQPKLRVSDVYVKPLVSEDSLELEVTILNNTDSAQSVELGGSVKEWVNLAKSDTLSAPAPKWKLGAEVLTTTAGSAEIPAGESKTITVATPVKGALEFWSPDAPNLYGLTLDLKAGGESVDSKYQRFGWREWTMEGTKHLLNGEPIELRGDSWHFQGIPQMTRRYAWAWYKTIQDANGNAVRPHAQVYPRFYMEMADEMGICVLSETSNWASDGGPKFDSDTFWKYSDEHLERLILRDRNYASVFGWSLTNENRPVIMHVFNRPDLMPVQVDAWARWVKQTNELDPTRPWISGDGDYDGEGTLPTVVGHYGNDDSMKKWSSMGKPWGVGEHSMAYYGTPKQVSSQNGNRSYESQLGRMEGLAYECYNLIAMQRQYDAAYVSIFNIAWYALKPLALGLDDTTKPVTLEDGIFVTRAFVEGEPGVQPERIGPYSTTLNPGYDPKLPLYDPWPMFDAVKAANHPDGPAPSEWDTLPVEIAPVAAEPKETYSKVNFLGKDGARLQARLAARGVDFETEAESGSPLTIIDGSYAISKAEAKELKKALKKGADVWVWGITPETAEAFNELLPYDVEVTNREATSLLVESDAQIISGLQHVDFYFSEIQRTPAMSHGLTGKFVEKNQVVLKACDTNWLRWNKVDETIKTAATLRSEREAKSAGAALVVAEVGKGQLIVNTMTEFYQTDSGLATLQTMLKNMGVPVRKAEMDTGAGIFDIDGNLKKALVIGAFGADSHEAAFATDFIEGETKSLSQEGDTVGGKTWKQVDVADGGDFNFKRMKLDGPMDNSAAYLSFWLWSPRPLDDLLIEPDMPKLNLIAGADDSHKIWLNGELLHEKFRSGPMVMGEIECKTMPVKQGWNHFLVKVGQGTGNWQFSAKLTCSDYNYLAKLKAAFENPDQD